MERQTCSSCGGERCAQCDWRGTIVVVPFYLSDLFKRCADCGHEHFLGRPCPLPPS